MRAALGRAMRACAAAAAAALAAGCTLIGHERVADWPHLAVIEHHVPHAQMRERCARYVGLGLAPEACAEFHLARGECHIWFSSDFPPTAAVRRHERLHCAGYDHVGGTTMARLLERHRLERHGAASAGASGRRPAGS